MKAEELCIREVATANRETSIVDAARMMRDKHVASLIVIDDSGDRQEPVGIITDRDIVIEIIAENVDPGKVTVGDIMTVTLLRVSAKENILDTAQRMRTSGVRRALVTKKNGELVGIVSMSDISKLLSEELCVLSHITEAESIRPDFIDFPIR